MPQTGLPDLAAIFASGTETATLLRTVDWVATPLGSPDAWPQSLLSTLSICMNTRFPISIFWGPEHVLLYNDAAMPMFGAKHPAAFGCTARQVWAEVWNVVEPRFSRVMNGEAMSAEDEQFALLRHGYLEECYFDYANSPVRGEGGHVVGIFSPATETTYRVVAARRSHILRELTEAIATAESVEQVCAAANRVLAAASADVPFCCIYLVDDAHRHARRIDVAGFAPDDFAHNDAVCPHSVDLAQHSPSPWPLTLACQTQQLQVVDDLQNKITSPVPGGAWPEAARSAVVVPIKDNLRTAVPAGLLVLGVSPRRAFDEQYREFVQAIADNISAAVANARNRDQQRQALHIRLVNLANVAPVALFELRMDAAGNMTMPYSSPAIMDIYGMTPDEMANDFPRALALIHPDDQVVVQTLIEGTARGAQNLQEQWRVRHPTKGEIWVEGHSTLEAQPDGTIIWYGYMLDVTQRRRQEQALHDDKARYRQLAEEVQRLNAELEQRVAARTAALAEANRELELFAYTVSHDLRAPLRGINGFAQVLIEDEGERLSAEGLRIVGRIKEAGSKLDHLIQDILEYGRVGQLPMTRQNIDMLKLVREVVDELRSQYHGVQIQMEALPSVEGDATLLRLVMQNLISNALKYSSRQALPTIHIGAQQQAGETIYFVRDNGVGFEMAQASVLFNMFRRLHSERDFPGTGVGLAIVKRLIERHDGRIWVESSPGQGATFFFTLNDKQLANALEPIRRVR